MASEGQPDGLREFVVDGASDDIEKLRFEWSSRTAYGKLRMLPLVVIYPIAAGALTVAASGMWILFTALEKLAIAHERVRELSQQVEPEVYKADD